MKRFIFLLPIVAILCACADQNQPTAQKVYVSFSYSVISPLMIKCTNQSSGCVSYKWDFGDGMTSTGKDAYHQYEKIGTYAVTLTGITADGTKHQSRKQVTISQPTIYFAGYTLYSIPYENRYYKLSFKDDNLLPSSWDFATVYSPLLDNSDLPYIKSWSNPQKLENIQNHSYYKVELIRSTNTSSTSNDASCFSFKIPISDILQYDSELIYENTSASCRVGIHLKYTY